MRSDAAEYAMVAPPTLDGVLRLLAEEPGAHRLLAGGTELMVAFCAGQLTARRLISIQHLRELRFITADAERVTIGSGTTFMDLRRSAVIAEEFTLLAQAASWTGSVANQNRATLGGNVVNASPAADSPPALLVYGAEVHLVSVRGMRSVAYGGFHVGYKRVAMEADELLHSISLPRVWGGYGSYARKVGTRRAQAISKVAVAGLAKVEGGVLRDVRLAMGSVAEVPLRCLGAEAAVRGKGISSEMISAGREALLLEVRPMDDVRSTARYRAAVAANLLEEFLLQMKHQKMF